MQKHKEVFRKGKVLRGTYFNHFSKLFMLITSKLESGYAPKLMKYDWKKVEKQFYLPKTMPEIIEIPPFKFFTIEGKGNPNDPAFSEFIGVLYALAYSVRMSPKQGNAPEGYYEYTVFPLEGVWDIDDDAKWRYNGKLD